MTGERIVNVQQAQSALDAAKERVNVASRRRSEQAVVVRDLEGQMSRLTSATSLDEASQVAAKLNGARTILTACDREVEAARQDHRSCEGQLRNVRETAARLDYEARLAEAEEKGLQKQLQAAEQSVVRLNDAIASKRRSIANKKQQHAAMIGEVEMSYG